MARIKAIRRGRDVGMATAEYAVASVAACGFGGVLYKLLTNDSILSLLTGLISKALRFGM